MDVTVLDNKVLGNADQSGSIPGSNSQSHLSVLVILVLATLARLGVVWFAIAHPTSEWPVGGGNEEAVLARSMLAGHGFSSPFGGSTGPTAFVTPGYPILVAGVFHFFGTQGAASIFVVLLLQAAFSVATIALLMHLARRIFDGPTATVAGLLWALSPPMIWMPTIFWDTCLSTLLLMCIIALALRCRKAPTLGIWILMGALTGLTGLINPSLLPAFLAVIAWCAYQRRTRAKLRWQPVLAVLLAAAIFAPWPVRNLKVMHAFIPLRSNLGFELWNGNTPGGDGKFIDALHPYNSKVEFARYAELGEVAYMQEKSSMAKASIKANPGRFVAISFKRVWDFWFGLAQPKRNVSFLLALHPILTTLGGAAGLLLLFKKHRATAWLFLLPLLIFPLPYYVTHPDLRFRLLLDPLLAMLAAYAFTQLLAHLTVEPEQAAQTAAQTTAQAMAPETVTA